MVNKVKLFKSSRKKVPHSDPRELEVELEVRFAVKKEQHVPNVLRSFL